ncbi:MAG: YhdH/YhfP family quinone oxidoreductase [Oleibacter sp.]|nr:YhdH/YhfP family quinone oxidoreductase [Thalassolituus sp.]
MTFLAYQVSEQDDGMQANWIERSLDELPAGDVVIDVEFSSLNYKDALSASGNHGVTKSFPHTPGIDAAGSVVSSDDDAFKVGQQVMVFGYDLGMNTAGGFAKRIRVPAKWVLTLPEGIDAATAMSWGTAGFTAALSVLKLERAGISPKNGSVVVTGATGGVGTVGVLLLNHLGYDVIAVSGKSEQEQALLAMGASSVISREDLMAVAGKAMARPQFQAALDTVGGTVLEALIPQIQPEGAVSTCGMIGGVSFKASVFPFIIRGISLLGVDSVEIPVADKQAVVDKVAGPWRLDALEASTTEIGRGQLGETLTQILAGKGVGRYRLNLSKA